MEQQQQQGANDAGVFATRKQAQDFLTHLCLGKEFGTDEFMQYVKDELDRRREQAAARSSSSSSSSSSSPGKNRSKGGGAKPSPCPRCEYGKGVWGVMRRGVCERCGYTKPRKTICAFCGEEGHLQKDCYRRVAANVRTTSTRKDGSTRKRK